MQLPYDPFDAVTTISSADPSMGALIHAAGPYELNYQPLQDLFEALCQSIVYQQLSGKAAATIFGRFQDLFDGDGTPIPSAVLKMDTDILRSVGLSGAKTSAIQDLAEKTLSGDVPTMNAMRTMTEQEILDRLTRVRGIGPWTVEMLMIFRLGMPDVMPATDLGIRKGFTRVFGIDALAPPKMIRERSELWKPFRSVASWYLWRAVDLDEFTPIGSL